MEKLIATSLLSILVLFFSVNAKSSTAPLDKETSEIVETETETKPKPLTKINNVKNLSSKKKKHINKSINKDLTENEAALLQRLAYINLRPFGNTSLSSIDTIPTKPKNSSHYSYHFSNGKTVEIESKNGQVNTLKIDGKRIPKNDWENYKEELASLKDVPAPPTPPSPPAPSGPRFAPPVPPAPPAHPTPPTPPVPPNGLLDSSTRTSHITKEIDQDGNTVIVIQSDDSKEPIRIKVDAEDQSSITINGKELEKDIIINEHFENPLEDLFDEKEDVYEKELENILQEHEENIFRHNEELKEYEEEMEEWEKTLEKDMEKFGEEMGEFGESMGKFGREFGESMGKFGEELGKSISKMVLDMPSVKANKLVYEELVKDGHAKDGKKFSYKLSKDCLYINGKKQSKAVTKKYQNIYESALGRSLESDECSRVNGKYNGNNTFNGSINF